MMQRNENNYNTIKKKVNIANTKRNINPKKASLSIIIYQFVPLYSLLTSLPGIVHPDQMQHTS